MKKTEAGDFERRKINEEQRILHIDITFDDSGSLMI
jgi:hypothetical protein